MRRIGLAGLMIVAWSGWLVGGATADTQDAARAVEGSADDAQGDGDQPTDDGGGGSEDPPTDTTTPEEDEVIDEPVNEPGDVAPLVWLGVGFLVVLAVIWAVARSGGDESDSDEPTRAEDGDR